MIGSFPIGTVPIGSNQLAGIEVVSLGVADATSAGLLLNIGIQIGQGSATAQGLTASEYISLQLGQAQVDTSVFDVIPKTTLDLVFAHAIASGESLGNLQIRLKIGRADSDAQALNVDSKHILSLGQALAESQGLNFSGLGLGLFPADSVAEMQRPGLGIPLLTKDISAQALPVISVMKPELGQASATINALSFNPITIELFDGDMVASALDGDITYLIREVPEIVVDRTSTQAVLKVLNQNQNNLRIFRADDHRGQFSVIQSNWNDATDYTDSGLDASKNYKYVAAFVVVGNKGGAEFIVTGQRCLPVYTIGNQIL